MTCFAEENTRAHARTHLCHLSEVEAPLTRGQRGKKNRKKKTETKTSYGTLFLLKGEAALFPFVREVLQDCTTEYHPRPKCCRNTHRYINIKISPIQTLYANLIPRFSCCTHRTACVPCVVRDVVVVLVYESVYVCECICVYMCVCRSVWTSSVQTTCTSIFKTSCLTNPTGWDSEGKVQGEGEQDGTNGEIYKNGR